jgi:hypothetical protein
VYSAHLCNVFGQRRQRRQWQLQSNITIEMAADSGAANALAANALAANALALD